MRRTVRHAERRFRRTGLAEDRGELTRLLQEKKSLLKDKEKHYWERVTDRLLSKGRQQSVGDSQLISCLMEFIILCRGLAVPHHCDQDLEPEVSTF